MWIEYQGSWRMETSSLDYFLTLFFRCLWYGKPFYIWWKTGILWCTRLALQWFQNHLSDRKRYVEYNNVYSNKNIVTCSIRQGSILGPLFFLLCINDLWNLSKKLSDLLFVDDSNVFYLKKTPKKLDNLIKIMNDEIVIVVDWLQLNSLSSNFDLKACHFISQKTSYNIAIGRFYHQQYENWHDRKNTISMSYKR